MMVRRYVRLEAVVEGSYSQRWARCMYFLVSVGMVTVGMVTVTQNTATVGLVLVGWAAANLADVDGMLQAAGDIPLDHGGLLLVAEACAMAVAHRGLLAPCGVLHGSGGLALH
jgi:hypothetical protein